MRRKSKTFLKILRFSSIFLLLILTFAYIWGVKSFGDLRMDEIIFTLGTSLEGTSSGMVVSYLVFGLLPALLVFTAILLLSSKSGEGLREHLLDRIKIKPLSRFITSRHNRRLGMSCLILLWAVILFCSANANLGIVDYVKSILIRSEFIEEHYVAYEPSTSAAETGGKNRARVEFPAKKRNLIHILVESGESSLMDKENGGLFNENYTPELTDIARENVFFSQDDKFSGAITTPGSTWTVAGMVSEYGGIPLKIAIESNSMDKCDLFLPGAYFLGDILQDAGYKNYFMCGSVIDFGGRRKLLEQHGDYEIFDYVWAKETGRIPKDYFVWWGYEDQKLFDFAKEMLTKINPTDQPFNFSILTVDTHHIGGYKCEKCQNEFADQYANVYACSSRQIKDFVDWIKKQDFYENTSIVITGDHDSMDPNFFSPTNPTVPQENTKESDIAGFRKVYNAFINPAEQPLKMKNRRFTTLDFYPTILASLGVDIEGDRLGLGTNLFSDRDTLAEEYGYAYLAKEINRRSSFYDHILLYGEEKQDD